MFQKILGILMIFTSVFIFAARQTVRNPEFLWALLILGVIFILIPKNLFE